MVNGHHAVATALLGVLTTRGTQCHPEESVSEDAESQEQTVLQTAWSPPADNLPIYDALMGDGWGGLTVAALLLLLLPRQQQPPTTHWILQLHC